MSLYAEERASDSPLVERIWRVRSHEAGAFMSQAAPQWEMVVVAYQGETHLTLRGPETKASLAHYPAEAEFFGIVFRLGTFMPTLPLLARLDRRDLTLPAAGKHRFWLDSHTWALPNYDNADTFVARLARQGLLQHDPVVDRVLCGQPSDLSPRTVRRRFLRATGLTHTTIFQIERAQHALALLSQGVSILDTLDSAGYFDQPHLTRALRRFVGHTPAQIAANPALAVLYKTDAPASATMTL